MRKYKLSTLVSLFLFENNFHRKIQNFPNSPILRYSNKIALLLSFTCHTRIVSFILLHWLDCNVTNYLNLADLIKLILLFALHIYNMNFAFIIYRLHSIGCGSPIRAILISNFMAWHYSGFYVKMGKWLA